MKLHFLRQIDSSENIPESLLSVWFNLLLFLYPLCANHSFFVDWCFSHVMQGVQPLRLQLSKKSLWLEDSCSILHGELHSLSPVCMLLAELLSIRTAVVHAYSAVVKYIWLKAVTGKIRQNIAQPLLNLFACFDPEASDTGLTNSDAYSCHIF